MTYELAIELKKAGFPQEGKYRYGGFVRQEIYVQNKINGEWYPGDKEPLLELKDNGRNKPYKWPLFSFWRKWDFENLVYNPHLDELIEALGKDFFSLEAPWVGTDQWMAFRHSDLRPAAAGGSTPEEAVARLWLALNKNP